MKCLMPLNQRKAIAEAIDGKRYVEWGVGGTTVWLADNASPSSAISIEHILSWSCKMPDMLPLDWRVMWRACQPGKNATKGEEYADDSDLYVSSGAEQLADVYLIDGVVRGKCLRALVETGQPMTVFIHDTQRDWYDRAIAEAVAAGFKRTDYPEGDDYPGCLLTKLEKR